jgi:hypothetical protein
MEAATGIPASSETLKLDHRPSATHSLLAARSVSNAKSRSPLGATAVRAEQLHPCQRAYPPTHLTVQPLQMLHAHQAHGRVVQWH